MKIIKEYKEEWTKMDIDMSEEERAMLVDYGKKKIMDDEMALINWAFTDILKKSIDEGFFNKFKPTKKQAKITKRTKTAKK